jgi:hypothetical protein
MEDNLSMQEEELKKNRLPYISEDNISIGYIYRRLCSYFDRTNTS